MRYFVLIFCIISSINAFSQDTNANYQQYIGRVSERPLLKYNSKWDLHFQTTYIYQEKPSFNSPYAGPNSLSGKAENVNSITATLFFGVRLWKGAEFYFDPEVAGGRGLSGAFGLAASTNGETFRVGDPDPSLYIARGFIKQTIAIRQEEENTEEGPNQLGGNIPKDYVQFMLGKFSIADIMDNNVFANSPRNQFLNWELMNNGAWDYAANLRGYTYSFATIVEIKEMTYKVALATLPVAANGNDLNTNLQQEYAINAEVIKNYQVRSRAGHVRLLGFYNNGHMGNYKEAILNADNNNPPDVISTRKYGRDKYGFGLNADQQLNDYLGAFIRLGWNDGNNETWCFTEADAVVSGGLSTTGAPWHRKDDALGLGLVVNSLSMNHREYLADGGLGFQLGDGKLNYGHETATELYYSFKPTEGNMWLSADYQLVLNPGYNKDRGPVNVLSFRVHVEF